LSAAKAVTAANAGRDIARANPTEAKNNSERRSQKPIPPITIYAVLVWLLWGFFMAIGWALGTWVMDQVLGRVLRTDSLRRTH
jgi:hypothetical protein